MDSWVNSLQSDTSHIEIGQGITEIGYQVLKFTLMQKRSKVQ